LQTLSGSSALRDAHFYRYIILCCGALGKFFAEEIRFSEGHRQEQVPT